MARDNELPLISNCCETDPEETFLPAFVGLPDVIGALLVFPLAWWRKVSAHLVKYGAMMECPECGHRNQPEIKFKLTPGEDPMMGGGGKWVPFDEPVDEGDVLGEKLAAMSPSIRSAIRDRLASDFPDDPVLKHMNGDTSSQ